MRGEKGGRMILWMGGKRFGERDKKIVGWGWFGGFEGRGYVVLCWGCVFEGFVF